MEVLKLLLRKEVSSGGYFKVFIGRCRRCGGLRKVLSRCDQQGVLDILLKPGQSWTSPKNGKVFTFTQEEAAEYV
jgi:hypothetical protein